MTGFKIGDRIRVNTYSEFGDPGDLGTVVRLSTLDCDRLKSRKNRWPCVRYDKFADKHPGSAMPTPAYSMQKITIVEELSLILPERS